MARLRYNGLRTTLGASLTTSATAVTFGAALTHSAGTAVPTLAAGDYIPLAILDSSGHLSEIVYLTAYTSGGTSGTITRAQEGTTGVTHASGDTAICTATVADIPSGFTQLRKSADQSIPNNTWTAVTWDLEDYDTLSLHSTTTNTSRLTVPTTAIYSIQTYVALASGGNTKYLSYYLNGTQLAGWAEKSGTSINVLGLAREIPLTAGDYIEAFVYQNSGGALALQHDILTQVNGAIMTCRLVGTI